MNGSVSSFGSPTPKSISSMPRARAAAFASSRRTNGYVWSGDSGTALDPRHEPPQRVEAALERSDLDLLVDPVREPRRAGAEVDGDEAELRELRDGRPRLLRLDREPAELDQAREQRLVEVHVGRARMGQDLELGAVRCNRCAWHLPGTCLAPDWHVAVRGA